MKKLFDSWIASLITLTLIGVLVIGIYHIAIKPGVEPLPGGNGGVSAGVPSDSCVLCHTDESVIAASTVGQEEEEEEEASGG